MCLNALSRRWRFRPEVSQSLCAGRWPRSTFVLGGRVRSRRQPATWIWHLKGNATSCDANQRDSTPLAPWKVAVSSERPDVDDRTALTKRRACGFGHGHVSSGAVWSATDLNSDSPAVSLGTPVRPRSGPACGHRDPTAPINTPYSGEILRRWSARRARPSSRALRRSRSRRGFRRRRARCTAPGVRRRKRRPTPSGGT